MELKGYGYYTTHTEYPSESPWKRRRDEFKKPPGLGLLRRIIPHHGMNEAFDDYKYVNMDIDIHTKRAALKASASVVALVCLKGGETIFMASGTIIESSKRSDGTYLNTILTSASLVRGSDNDDDDFSIQVHLHGDRVLDGCIFAYDIHYNIAIVNLHSDKPLPVATLRLVDDSISIDPTQTHSRRDNFQLHPHSDSFKLIPGEMVVALGRRATHSQLMVAPGVLSLDICKYDCKELMRATCKITKPGIGGPLLNCYGDVIGINFYDERYTPFLPSNIVSKCLAHHKKHGGFCRPWLGIEATNLYAANRTLLEHVIHNFPNIFKGVLVEEVISGSPADCAGISHNDVIVQCDGNYIHGFLEFWGKIMDKVGETVEVVVIRKGQDVFSNLSMLIQETSPDKLNSWPIPEATTTTAFHRRSRN